MSGDDLLFIHAKMPKGNCIIVISDPFLYASEYHYHGKVMYSTIPVHGEFTIKQKHHKHTIYKTAYRQKEDGTTEAVTDSELQKVGIDIGLEKGYGLDKYLCGLPHNTPREIFRSPLFLTQFHSDDAIEVADEIARAYNVDSQYLKITGGLHLFPQPLSEAHDIDLVIPIDSDEQLRTIYKHIDENKDPVYEYGYFWPLRWISKKSHLICPFFVYRDLQPPIIALDETCNRIQDSFTIKDDLFGVFNAPVLITQGECDLIFCRSTLLRGMLRKGHEIIIDCPLYKVVNGAFTGAKTALITNPFKEIYNLQEILHEYNS